MHGAPLVLYNSLTRAAEPFAPIDPDNVRIYSCGPTVYHYAHIGNLRAYVFTDTLARTIRWKGWPLTHVINITDVGHLTSDADAGDDKMEAAARERGQDIWAIAAHYTGAFERNLDQLNIRRPAHMPRATEFVPHMIAWGEAIAEHCYLLDDGFYFDVSTVPDYGGLAHKEEFNAAFEVYASGGDAETANAAADHAASQAAHASRIGLVAGKRHPQDFAIWRTSAPGERRQMEWDSPWGRGAPGWHLECSVMSRYFLGERFDIHTGGIDHREIHHPNEIAQNQAHSGSAETGANWWMHNNFVVQSAGKMSKSAGDFTTLQSLVERGVHPLAYRLMCLQAHYRSELEFSWEGLLAALTRLKRLAITVAALRARAGEAEGDGAPAYREQLDAALSDDLNTPKALTVLDAMLADKTLTPATRLAALDDYDAVLGLRLKALAREELRVRPASATLTEAEVDEWLAARREARAARDFAASDRIRDTLAADGVEVMDGDALGWDWVPG